MMRDARALSPLLIALLLAGCAGQMNRVEVRQTSLTPHAPHQTHAPPHHTEAEEVWIIARAAAPAAEQRVDDAALVRAGGEEAGQALPLVAATVRASIRGLTCDVALTQRFTNPHAEPIDAAYRFPLPADARVRAIRPPITATARGRKSPVLGIARR